MPVRARCIVSLRINSGAFLFMFSNVDCFSRADCKACLAFCTVVLVNEKPALKFSNRSKGACLLAEAAEDTVVIVYLVQSKAIACFCAAVFIIDVLFVFVHEVLQSGKHRLGAGLPEAAQ